MKKVAFDFDGVICDSLSFLCQKAMEVYGVRLEPSQVNTWRLYQCSDLTEEQEYALLREFLKSEYADQWKPVPGAKEALQSLPQKAIIVSQRYPHQDPSPFLEKLGIDFDLYMVEKYEDKLKVLKDLGTEIFFEDRPETIKLLSKHLDVAKFEHLYNQGFFGEKWSVKRWEEAKQILQPLKKKKCKS